MQYWLIPDGDSGLVYLSNVAKLDLNRRMEALQPFTFK